MMNWPDGATATMIDGKIVYRDKDGNPIAPRPRSWRPKEPKPVKVPKEPKPPKPKRPTLLELYGRQSLGLDFSYPQYRLFQNDAGGFERWNVVRSVEQPQGRTMATKRSDVWYVFVCDLD